MGSTDPVIWSQVKGSPPAQQSLRGKTIVVGNNANAHVHPLFAEILNRAASVPFLGQDLVLEGEEPASAEREAYIAALKRHDWHHEWSDDGRVYRAGRDSLAALKRMRAAVDADGAVWNAHAPAEFRVRA